MNTTKFARKYKGRVAHQTIDRLAEFGSTVNDDADAEHLSFRLGEHNAQLNDIRDANILCNIDYLIRPKLHGAADDAAA